MTDRLGNLEEFGIISSRDSLGRYTLSMGKSCVDGTVASVASMNLSSAGTLNNSVSDTERGKAFEIDEHLNTDSKLVNEYSYPMENGASGATTAVHTCMLERDTRSFLDSKYGEAGHPRRRQPPSYFRKLQHEIDMTDSGSSRSIRSSTSGKSSPRHRTNDRNVLNGMDQISDTSTSLKPIKIARVHDRVLPVLDLEYLRDANPHEFKAGPIYEDCSYDDDEMRLSSFVDHGVIFDPVFQQDEEGVANPLANIFALSIDIEIS